MLIVAKGFLKLPNSHMLLKQESIISQKRDSGDFWQIAYSVLNNLSTIPPLFNGPKGFSSGSDKAKFAKNLFKNSNLDDSFFSLPVFPSRTNLKLHNISVTLRMVKKVITNLGSSKTSGPYCIPVVGGSKKL